MADDTTSSRASARDNKSELGFEEHEARRQRLMQRFGLSDEIPGNETGRQRIPHYDDCDSSSSEANEQREDAAAYFRRQYERDSACVFRNPDQERARRLSVEFYRRTFGSCCLPRPSLRPK